MKVSSHVPDVFLGRILCGRFWLHFIFVRLPLKWDLLINIVFLPEWCIKEICYICKNRERFGPFHDDLLPPKTLGRRLPSMLRYHFPAVSNGWACALWRNFHVRTRELRLAKATKTTISSAAHQLCNRWARFRRTLSLSHRKAIFHLGRGQMSRESNKIGPELELEIWNSFGNSRGCDWSACGYARCWYDWLTFENAVVFLCPAVDAEWGNQTLSFSQLMPTIGQLEPFVTPSWIYNFSINKQL